MAHIAFLGTGLLGSAFAEAAAKRGDTVTAWNRSPEKVRALAEFGVKAAATPAEAVRGASRVHLVLKDDAVVNEVIAAARPALSADAILIDHSTTLPAGAAERFAHLQAQGVKYLHCPVFMGPAAARSAQGLMLVTGPGALFESVQADLARMTGRLEYLGERISHREADSRYIDEAMASHHTFLFAVTSRTVIVNHEASAMVGPPRTPTASRITSELACENSERTTFTDLTLPP